MQLHCIVQYADHKVVDGVKLMRKNIYLFQMFSYSF